MLMQKNCAEQFNFNLLPLAPFRHHLAPASSLKNPAFDYRFFFERFFAAFFAPRFIALLDDFLAAFFLPAFFSSFPPPFIFSFQLP